MTIAELLEELGTVKTAANAHYREYKRLKESEDAMKAELTAMLNEAGLKSAKGKKFTASMRLHTDVVINHEQSVIEWLKTTPDVEADAYIGLKVTPFKSFAKLVLKETGEVIPGTDLSITESLAIKANT